MSKDKSNESNRSDGVGPSWAGFDGAPTRRPWRMDVASHRACGELAVGAAGGTFRPGMVAGVSVDHLASPGLHASRPS
jgi:hypothetical protein